MVGMQSATDEIRRKKKKKVTTPAKYNVRICYAGPRAVIKSAVNVQQITRRPSTTPAIDSRRSINALYDVTDDDIMTFIDVILASNGASSGHCLTALAPDE